MIVDLLKDRYIRFFLSSRAVSAIGSNLSKIALVYLISSESTPYVLSLYFTILSLPVFFVPFIASFLADKYRVTSLLVIADITAGFISLILFAIILVQGFNGVIVPVFILIFILSCATSIYPSLVGVVVKGIVPKEKVKRYISISQPTVNISYSIGEILGSALIKLLNVAPIFLIDCFTFFFSAFLVSRIKTSDNEFKSNIRFYVHLREVIKRTFADRFARRVNFGRFLFILIETQIYMTLPFLIKDKSIIGFVLGMNTLGLIVGSWLHIRMEQGNSINKTVYLYPAVVAILLLTVFKLNISWVWASLIFIKSILSAIYSQSVLSSSIDRYKPEELTKFTAGSLVLMTGLSCIVSIGFAYIISNFIEIGTTIISILTIFFSTIVFYSSFVENKKYLEKSTQTL